MSRLECTHTSDGCDTIAHENMTVPYRIVSYLCHDCCGAFERCTRDCVAAFEFQLCGKVTWEVRLSLRAAYGSLPSKVILVDRRVLFQMRRASWGHLVSLLLGGCQCPHPCHRYPSPHSSSPSPLFQIARDYVFAARYCERLYLVLG